MNCPDKDATLVPALQGSAELGYYLQDDISQNQKHLSTISTPLPYMEKNTVSFLSADVTPTSPVSLVWTTSFGLPDLLFFRIRQEIASYNLICPPEDYHARIDSLTLRIWGSDNTLLKTVNHKQLRELTRQN